ncbi:hypothetical protein N9465_00355 [Gammaproteobacteria bacterium]|nr:hypothetical protein [Gammaproteobacteria bacterium]
MSTELAITTTLNEALPTAAPEYKSMLSNIAEKMPAVTQATSNFHKSHSQFMGVTLDVTAITPIRSIKHTLAEIDKTRSALQEAYINLRKKEVKLKKKQAKLIDCREPLARELLEIEILEIQGHLEGTRNAVQGAVRKMNFFTNQYDNLMKKIGKEKLSEEDYELEEARYHIMTCMKQALNSARPRQGVIDEGNMIYLFDLGINAAQAQAEVFSYLNWENELVKQGKAPEHEHTVQWLEGCADKWAGCPAAFANSRGFDVFDPTSLANTPQIEDKSNV